MQQLYDSDFTVIEAVNHLRILTIKQPAMVTIRWTDHYGGESATFSNNEEIRHFLCQNPKLHKSMDLGDVENRIFGNKPGRRS